MGFFDVFAYFFFKVQGVHANRVGLEDFTPRFTAVLKAMILEREIEKLAGIDDLMPSVDWESKLQKTDLASCFSIS